MCDKASAVLVLTVRWLVVDKAHLPTHREARLKQHAK
jgi:hypothetical protein